MIFELRPKICYGVDSINILDNMNYKKVCIATDQLMIDIGILELLTDKLDVLGIEYHVFNDIEPDPSIEIVKNGLSHIIRTKPDALIALGGGSVIDAAKAIIYMCLNTKKIFIEEEYIHKPDFIAIPTTAGTGSEVTEYAVITDKVNGVKIPIKAKEMLPDMAILEPKFVTSVPKSVTASTGIDVLTHSIEAYVSNNSNAFSEAYALKATKMTFENLYNSYLTPKNLTYRENMQIASCIAGIAFNNSGLGITHSIAHSLGAMYKLPHGLTNAIVLPYVMKFNARDKSTLIKYSEIAQNLGCDQEEKESKFIWLLYNVIEQNIKMDIPLSLVRANIDKNKFESNLDEIANKVMDDICTTTNPVKVSREEIIKLLNEIYYGTELIEKCNNMLKKV